MKGKKILFLFCFAALFSIGLAGCTSMSSPPRCPDSTGLTCARVDQINSMINHGKMGVSSSHDRISHSRAFQPVVVSSAPTDLPMPLGRKEKMMCVWIAPYEDASGNYHQASVVDIPIQSRHARQSSKTTTLVS